jgi:macrolide-specific efflux system membrane fusion protein
VKARLPRSPLTYILAGLCVVVVAIAFVLVGPPAAPEAQQREVTVARGVVQSTVSGSGNLEPASEFDLSFGTSGTVTAVYVEAGEKVVEGQTLARLDPRSARVQLARAKADNQAAEDALASIGASADAGATTTTAPDTPSNDAAPASPTISAAEAEANLESARLALEEAEQALANTVLTAPASGTIAEVNGAVGDSTGGGSTESQSSSQSSESTAGAATFGGGGTGSSSTSSGASSSGSGFVTLVRLEQLNLDVAFSESDIGKLKVGQAATVSINALADVELAARVTSIGTLPDSSGDVVEYPVTLTLKQMDRRLKPGMTASADAVVSQVEGVVSVPSQAISQGPGGATVTVVSDDGEQERRSVTTGVEGDTATEIVSGLSAGDRVVITTSAPGAGAGGAMPGVGGALPGGGGGRRGGGFPGGGPPGGGFPGGGLR